MRAKKELTQRERESGSGNKGFFHVSAVEREERVARPGRQHSVDMGARLARTIC